jgi:polar amino acid transport system substrate-binding protein
VKTIIEINIEKFCGFVKEFFCFSVFLWQECHSHKAQNWNFRPMPFCWKFFILMHMVKKNLILLLGLFVAIIGCEKKELHALDIIKKNDVLRIAVSGDDPPLGYIDEKGRNKGFEIEIAKRLAKELLGDILKIQFVIVEPNERIAVLENDKADIVLANFTITPERAQIVDFALPYMKAAIGVLSPKSAVIKNVEELNGKKLIVSKSTTAEEYFLENHPEVELLVFEQVTELFRALKDGRGAALADDNTILFALAHENPNFEVGISSIGSVDRIAPAVKKGNADLLGFINKTIKKLTAERFFHKKFETNIKPYMGAANPDDFVLLEGETL